jgi:uncharacterized protein (DUF433 family)
LNQVISGSVFRAVKQQQPGVMGGKAWIRGMCVTVEMIEGPIGPGNRIERLSPLFPYLEREGALQMAAVMRVTLRKLIQAAPLFLF